MGRTFDGSTSYIYQTVLPVSAPALTFACWMRPTSTAGGVCMILKRAEVNGDQLVLSMQGGTMYTVGQAYDRVNNGVAVGTVAATLNAWNHIAVTSPSAASRTVYTNGGDPQTNNITATPGSLTNFFIGASFESAVTAVFTGDIGEAAVWNVALTAGEIAALAAGVSPLQIRPVSLVSYWPLRGGLVPEIDLVSRNNLLAGPNTVGSTSHPRVFGIASHYVPKLGTIFKIQGTTKNTAGAILGGCTVKLFRASDDAKIATTVSDGAGAYMFTVLDGSTLYYAVAYKPGSPDVAGTTLNTLVGAP